MVLFEPPASLELVMLEKSTPSGVVKSSFQRQSLETSQQQTCTYMCTQHTVPVFISEIKDCVLIIIRNFLYLPESTVMLPTKKHSKQDLV